MLELQYIKSLVAMFYNKRKFHIYQSGLTVKKESILQLTNPEVNV